jgi:hypothetical protein
MPVYNGKNYVGLAIESILSQTSQDFEFIIIDDGSTDTSIDIIRSYQDPRIILFENGTNTGIVASLNRGLLVARGKYLARMDADDLCMPERMEKQFHYLEAHPEVGLLGTAIRVINETGRVLHVQHFPTQDSILRWRLLFSNPFAHSSIMIRRELALKENGYRDVASEDHDLWLRISRLSGISNLPEELVMLRRYPGTYTDAHGHPQLLSCATNSQVYLQELLCEPVPLTVVEALWGIQISDPEIVFQAVTLVHKILNIMSSRIPTGAERNAIWQDAARRVLKLIRQQCLTMRMRSSLLRSALAIDPFVPARIAANHLLIQINRPMYG